MAKAQLSHPFDEIHGALGKNEKIINRRKKFRDDKGRVIAEGSQEAYVVKHPRNWKKNPKQGAELANHNAWTEVCRRSSQILFVARLDQTPADQQQHMLDLELRIRKMNHVPEYYTLDEARLLLAEYKTRFAAQIPGKRGSHPDPQAPIDPLKGSGKRYLQFPAFLRAIIYHTLKNQ
ncbi:MAG: hypothetical protein IJ047_07390 [Paludibacteraceae bacterium]|nr:hypothetical protein [Paludibacteraceae bacterium]